MHKQSFLLGVLLLTACAGPRPRLPASAPPSAHVTGRCQIPFLGLVNEKAVRIEPSGAQVGARPEAGYFDRVLDTKVGKKLHLRTSQGRLTVSIEDENGKPEARMVTAFPLMVSQRAELTAEDHRVLAYHNTSLTLRDDHNLKVDVSCSIEPLLNAPAPCGEDEAHYCINL